MRNPRYPSRSFRFLRGRRSINFSGLPIRTRKSAGLEPGKLNPRVVQVMQEIGFDISGNQTRSVSDILDGGKQFDYVVTVCDEASAEKCPVFPGAGKRLHWGFTDPSSLTGTEEQKLQRTREIRDQIEARVRRWIAERDG